MTAAAPVADPPLLVAFAGVAEGPWRVASMRTLAGDGLAPVTAVAIAPAPAEPSRGAAWTLRGVTSNMRYTTGDEATRLRAVSPPLGRSEATRAALIPIRKSPVWWALPQDARREIYEERSRHTTIGMEYLPRIARRLHHARDLGEAFDFLTWFEFAPEHEAAFDALLARLRAGEEWTYVDREVEIRLDRAAV